MRQIIRVLVTVKYTEAFTRWLWMSKSDLPTDAAQLAECRGTISLCNRCEWFRDVDRQTLPNGRNKNTNIWESQAFSFPPPSSSFQVQRFEKMSPNLGALTNNPICSMFFAWLLIAQGLRLRRTARLMAQTPELSKGSGRVVGPDLAEHQIREGSPEQTPNQTSR